MPIKHAQERKREQERSKLISDRVSDKVSLLETQLEDALAKIDEKDLLIEALCTDLKLVQAARQAEHTSVKRHIQRLDEEREQDLARVRQEELETCQRKFMAEQQKLLEELEASRQKIATAMKECEDEVQTVKQKANSTAEELRAQVRALMEREEERGLDETKRVCHLQDLLRNTKVRISRCLSVR
jgi:hypothetical protein